MSDQPQTETAFELRDRKAKQAVMNECLEKLRDAGFETVIVLGSWQTQAGMTAAMNQGRGDWYAQSGLMQHLLNRRKEVAHSEARENLHGPDPDQ